MRIIFLLLFISILSNVSLSARILGYFPVPSISHQVVFRGLIDALAKRGHHIVIITPDPMGSSAPLYYKNVTEIDVHDISYRMMEDFFKSNTQHADSDLLILNWYVKLPDIVDAQLSSAPVKEFIKLPNQTFDLVLGESMLPFTFAFGAHFKAPFIGVSSLCGTVSNFEAVGSPSHPFLYADIFTRFIGRLDIFKKISILKTDLIQRYAKYLATPVYDELIKKHFGDGKPSVLDLENNMEMMFINQHPILAGVRPTVPAIVYMGNMHLKPQKPLPQDLKKMLDESTNGAVYFSLGSNVMSKDLPLPQINSILEAFSELKYTVLWKFENDTLEGRPDNVHISKWFPQMDLLGHPNIKVFITQGGQQSMEEALYNKVPFVGIPFMGDQYLNVQKMEELGIGIKVDISTLTKDNFKEAVRRVAEVKSYRENIVKLSALLEDQPMTGKERAVWWTEYVLRHGGARHLRAPAADVTWIKYFMLDVLVPLLILAITICISLYIAARKILKILMSLVGSEKLKTN